MPAPWPSIILLRASASPSPHQFPMTLVLFSIVWGCHTLSVISKSQRPAYVTHRSNEDERTLLGLVHLALEQWPRSFHPRLDLAQGGTRTGSGRSARLEFVHLQGQADSGWSAKSRF